MDAIDIITLIAILLFLRLGYRLVMAYKHIVDTKDDNGDDESNL